MDYMERKDWILFTLLLLLGLALRLDFLIANNFTIDSDEAIVGLMAKHINEGIARPVFYYGQHYLGSLESMIAALFFKVFGINEISLKAVPLTFSIIFIALIFFLTKEISNKKSAFFAMLLASVAPSSLIIWSGKARGGFIEVVVLGALALLLSFKWQKSEDKNKLLTFVIAGVLGLGWWVNNQIIYFIPAIIIIYLTRILCDKRDYFIKKRLAIYDHFLIAVVGFFLGSILFWIYNFRHNFISFEMLQSDPANFIEHAKNFFKYSLPIILGAKRYWSKADIFPYLTLVSYSLHIFLVLVFAFYKKEKKEVIGISYGGTFLVVFISTFFFFSYSKFGSLYLAPRYLLPLYVIIFPVLGVAIGKLYDKSKFLGITFLIALLSLYLISDYGKKRALLGEPLIFEEQRASDDHSDVISWLRKNKINVIRTNYWIGYRLAFETKEDIKFLVSGIPHTIRIKSYESLVSDDKRDLVPFLAVPREARYIRNALTYLGFSYKQRRFKNYRLIYNIKKNYNDSDLVQVSKNLISLEVSDNEALKHAINDSNIETRWGSGRGQASDMYVKFSFAIPTKVDIIEYILGNWEHDYPRELEIRGVNKKGEEKILLTPNDYKMFSYYLGSSSSNPKFKIPSDKYKSITFYQKGTDSFFDWSIAEMNFYSQKDN